MIMTFPKNPKTKEHIFKRMQWTYSTMLKPEPEQPKRPDYRALLVSVMNWRKK